MEPLCAGRMQVRPGARRSTHHPDELPMQPAKTDVMALFAVPDASKGLERHLEDRFTIVGSRTSRSR